MKQPAIYIGTVLLEANRWAAVRTPTCRISEWLDRFAAAGFDGLELWENHAALADEAERAALARGPLPVAVFNSYATLDAAGEAKRAAAAALVREFRAPAMKFNFSRDPAAVPAERERARAWSAAMPGVRLLCECHPGTALEDPAAAAAVLTGWPEARAIVHAFTCPDLAAWMRHLGPLTAHVHVQARDATGRLGSLRDEADTVRRRIGILRDAGYAGTFTIEFTRGVGTPPEDRERLFADAVEDLHFLRRCLEA